MDFNICPSCGAEFGYSDAGRTFDDLRAEWIDMGMPWHSKYEKPPRNWNPQLQLVQSGLLPVRISAVAEDEAAPEVFVWDQSVTGVMEWTALATSVA